MTEDSDSDSIPVVLWSGSPAEMTATTDFEVARDGMLEQGLDFDAVAGHAVGLIAGWGMHKQIHSPL